MKSHFLLFVAVSFVAFAPISFTSAATASFACCASIATGESYGASCNCLEDDEWKYGEVLAAGQSKEYHWRLTDWSIINVPDEQRPSITFAARPCSGSVELYIKPLQSPWPNSGTAKWASTFAYERNEITTPLIYSEYFVTVTATVTSNFSVAAILDRTFCSFVTSWFLLR